MPQLNPAPLRGRRNSGLVAPLGAAALLAAVTPARAATPDATPVAEVVPGTITGTHADVNAGLPVLRTPPRTPADGSFGSTARPATPIW
ncbi:hypothetical protein [Streptomyces sp. NBC_01669]|uniref:hypothetical protein n=1 Tax=Streptomyces sp. NBC_01669 TaxID=2975909 RepID=UPI002251C3EB|nr:hypothetical protein [Streptomyces sp. NBC_01669]MCX4531310.1 hypothetical protein [Streptomyces sp. NBC_01669]